MSSEADAAAGDGKKVLTKRQRRKMGANPSNTWPQMPKIQSSTARANAYLRVAGLVAKTNQTLDPELDLQSPEIRFGRLLGSPDQRVRHKAVGQLQQYLRARCDMNNHGLSELDLLKLWKGLWYTLYMADKVPVQDELSKKLAKLIWCVAGTEEEDEYAGRTYLEMYGDDDNDDAEERMGQYEEGNVDEEMNEDEKNGEDDAMEDVQPEEEPDEEEDGMDDMEVPHCRGAHLAALFVRTFFRTVHREWGRMDKFRVDKFYTLVRLMTEQIFRYMATRHWSLGIIRLFNDVIYEEVLSQTPNGLRLHMIDLTMDELAKVNTGAPMPLTEATFMDTLEPYFALVQTVKDRVVHKRIMENIVEKFLLKHSVVCEESNEQEEPLAMDQVHVRTIADYIFQLGSDPSTRDEYREALYSMYKTYIRRLKHVGKDVDLNVAGEEAFGLDATDEYQVSDDGEGAIAEGEEGAIVEGEEEVIVVEKRAKDQMDVENENDDEKGPQEEKNAAIKDPEPIVAEVDEDSKAKPSDEQEEDEATGKKRKRKQDEEVAEEETVTKSPLETPKKSKKKKKKKKRKGTPDEDSASVADSVTSQKEETKDEDTSAPSQPEPAKDPRPKKVAEEESAKVASPGGSGDDDSKTTNEPLDSVGDESMDDSEASGEAKKKRKKKKKKKKKTSGEATEPTSGDESAATEKKADEDDVITISIAEQKEAEVKAKKKKKKKEARDEEEDQDTPDASKRRRVSFGKMNQAKSHRDSFKALRKAQPKIEPISPDKSILRNKAWPPDTPADSNQGKKKKRKKGSK